MRECVAGVAGVAPRPRRGIGEWWWVWARELSSVDCVDGRIWFDLLDLVIMAYGADAGLYLDVFGCILRLYLYSWFYRYSCFVSVISFRFRFGCKSIRERRTRSLVQSIS